MSYVDWLAGSVGNHEGSRGLSFNYHLRFSSWLEIKVHNMVFTLSEFKLLVGCLNNVMP